jgi:hypothetical protein
MKSHSRSHSNTKGYPRLNVFDNGLDLRKWTGIIADLIDVRKKVRMFYIKK